MVFEHAWLLWFAHQVHKFVAGVTPIRSICRLGWATAQLLAIPSDRALKREAASRPCLDRFCSRQIRRSLMTFVQAVTLESLGLGQSIASSAQYIVQSTPLVGRRE